MLDRLMMRSVQPPEQPRRRGATQFEPEYDAFAMWRQLTQWLSVVPWLQLGLGAVVVMLAATLPWGVGATLDALDQQITGVEIEGDLHGLSREEVQQSLDGVIGHSFFATDLSEVKQQIERQPWVESAAVRRVWPDQLAIDIREEKPVAYWNGKGLIARSGHVIQPRNPEVAGSLPRLAGPDDRVGEVVKLARSMANDLQRQQLGFAGLQLAKRGAWTLRLANGIEVALGRDQVQARFQRFLTVYQARLASRAPEIERVDVRYSNGVAVRWRQVEKTPEKNS